MEDPTVRRLTKKIFPHLWVRHKLMSFVPSSGIFPFSEMTVFAQGIGNAVIVYLHMYRPVLSNYFEKHIPPMPKSKVQFWNHVAFLCLQARLINDNAFDYFLTTCAITAEVALHCYINGYDSVLSLASVFFCAFFENELYESFHRSGGWTGLHQYIEETSCEQLHKIVDGYIKEIDSPSEHLPILIFVQNELLAARRRKKFLSLFLFKICEIERKDKANTLVSRIFHWHFMENHRISKVKCGILKRMENVEHKKTKSNIFIDAGRRDIPSEADEVQDAVNQISNNFEFLFSNVEDQISESVSTMPKTPFSNKSTQTLDDSECKTQESKTQLCSNKETSEETKFSSSSSLHGLRNFYERLSSASENKTDKSKYFRSNNEKCTRLNSSTVKEMANRLENTNKVEICPRSRVSYPRENDETFTKSKRFTSENANKSTEPFLVDDVQTEFTKSFQELGFKCLCVGNSPRLDEKSENFEKYAEVIEKCRYYQSKYSSIQFAILIPNNYSTSETSHSSETKNYDAIFSKEENNEQLLSNITREYFKNCFVSSQKPHSEIEKARSEATTVDKNQFRSAEGLASLINSATENMYKSRFVVTKVKENDLSSVGEVSIKSRFSVTKVNEDQIISRDHCLLGNKCIVEPKTVSRFTITKVNESHSKEVTNIFGENKKNETKISRFTVVKVNENNSRDKAHASVNWKNETTKTSRFTVTKVDENELKYGARMLRKNWTNDTHQISRFIVTRVSENQDSLLERNDSSEMFGATENETVHFQDNGSVKYQKRVSFDEQPQIKYYETYSSDEYSNSITSRESFNQNSPEETQSARNPQREAKKVDTLDPPTSRNPVLAASRRFCRRFSSNESRSSSCNTENSNSSSSSRFFRRLFRRSTSRNSKADESPTENKAEQEIEELEKSLEDDDVEDPYVFKI